jgi:hypothetical protein
MAGLSMFSASACEHYGRHAFRSAHPTGHSPAKRLGASPNEIPVAAIDLSEGMQGARIEIGSAGRVPTRELTLLDQRRARNNKTLIFAEPGRLSRRGPDGRT